MCGKNCMLLFETDHKCKVEKMRQFLCNQMVDFAGPVTAQFAHSGPHTLSSQLFDYLGYTRQIENLHHCTLK